LGIGQRKWIKVWAETGSYIQYNMYCTSSGSTRVTRDAFFRLLPYWMRRDMHALAGFFHILHTPCIISDQ
jgi:hypothetical protein